jgi:hypothetical protein
VSGCDDLDVLGGRAGPVEATKVRTFRGHSPLRPCRTRSRQRHVGGYPGGSRFCRASPRAFHPIERLVNNRAGIAGSGLRYGRLPYASPTNGPAMSRSAPTTARNDANVIRKVDSGLPPLLNANGFVQPSVPQL